jgi:hypothetical protein
LLRLSSRDRSSLHEGVAVRRLLRDAQRVLRVDAAGEPVPMIQDQPIPFRQRRLRQERRESVSNVRAVHQHDRLSGTSDLVFQLPAIDPRSVHTWAPFKEERCDILGMKHCLSLTPQAEGRECSERPSPAPG